MKLKIFFSGILFSVVFASCGPEPIEYRTEFTGWAADGQSPVCDNRGRNCWLYIPDPLEQTNRVTLNNFYSNFSTNNLSYFFQNNNWRAIFPEYSPIDEDATIKISSGEYKTVLTGDSSIIILKNPKLGLTFDNVLYALDRTQ